ncbi:hypothetical protein HY251_16175 [bacterium]|nr:hypothetical protein [bacterium]
MSLTARRELERLLEPISPRAFFEESWEKKPLHVPGRPGKLAHVGFDRATFWKTVRELPDDAKCLRAIYHDAAGRHQDILELEPRMAEALFDSGMTIVFTQLEDHCEAVRELLVGLRAGMNLPGHITVGCFFSPEDHGAGLHYDNHSAIVLQLEGRKRWQVSKRPALEFPPRNYGYETDAALVERNARSPGLATELPVPDDFLEVELAPGDVFYMPPGTWHRPRATGGAGSLALTLGPFVKNPLQLVCEHLSRGLGERLEWRRSLPVGPASEAGTSRASGTPGWLRRRLSRSKSSLASAARSLPRSGSSSTGRGGSRRSRPETTRARRRSSSTSTARRSTSPPRRASSSRASSRATPSSPRRPGSGSPRPTSPTTGRT